MPRLALFSLACFVFLFAFSRADLPHDEPVAAAVSEADTRAAAATFVELDPEEIQPKVSESESLQEEKAVKLPSETQVDESAGSSDDGDQHASVATVTFHPINRHFPRQRLPFFLPFRHRPRCRHHRPRRLPWGPRFHDRAIPYGDDMIVSKEGAFPDRAGQIPSKWLRQQLGGPLFKPDGYWMDEKASNHNLRPRHGDDEEDELKPLFRPFRPRHDDDEDDDEMKTRFHHHHHRGEDEEVEDWKENKMHPHFHRHHDDDSDDEDDKVRVVKVMHLHPRHRHDDPEDEPEKKMKKTEEQEEENKDGFWKGIRKFLDRFD